MRHNSQPHDLDEILAGYVLGNLDEAELVWLNEQLIVDPKLKGQIVQLQETLTLMPYALSKDVPKTDLRERILAKTQANLSSKPYRYRWGWIVSAVTALAALGLGLSNYSLRQQIAIKEAQLRQQELITLLRQPNNRLVTFQGLDDVTASGSLFISPEKNKAVLALQNLEPLSGKQVYRLWAVSQKQKTGCANFTPNNNGMVHLEFSSDEALMNARSILITIEPEADTVQPIGNEFLTGSDSAI